MLRQYIETAMKMAKYKIIKDEEPFFGEIDELPGVWATGRTLEECRQDLADVIDNWIVFRLSQGLDIPPLGEVTLKIPAISK